MNPVSLEDLNYDKTYGTYVSIIMDSDYHLIVRISDQYGDFTCYSLTPDKKGWQNAEKMISALNCWTKHTKIANSEKIESNQKEVDKLTAIVKEWQKWWDETGFEWYKKGEFPQEQRPNFLKQESLFYNEWIN